MQKVEWEQITKNEFDKLKLLLAKTGMKIMGHTVTICEPPRWILLEDTGCKSYCDESWLLMISMDWMGPEGEVLEIGHDKDEKKFWRYYKNQVEISKYEGSEG